MTYRPKQLSVAIIEREIDRPAPQWEGNCYGIACKVAPLVRGQPVYGHYLGAVDPNGYWAHHARLPFIQHGWVVLPDNRILDPTRWSFENVEPYLWLGENDGSYDCGGNKLRKALQSPPPPFDPTEASHCLAALSDEAVDHLCGLLQAQAASRTFGMRQLFWLCNAPVEQLQPHAEEFFRAVVESGWGALIPMDNREMVLGKQ